MRLLSAFYVPLCCCFCMLCVCPGPSSCTKKIKLGRARPAQLVCGSAQMCSGWSCQRLQASSKRGCGGQMFPWTFCRTKSLKSMERVSPWKDFFHARLSKSKHTWTCDSSEKQGSDSGGRCHLWQGLGVRLCLRHL